jgi:signal transduction histidine kinase
MKARAARRLAWGIWGASIVGILVAFGASMLRSDSWLSGGAASVAATVGALVFVGACATVGALVASRRPENAVGWLLIAGSLCFALPAVAIELGAQWQRYSDWLGNWIWMAGIAFVMSFVPLLFPNGHLPSRRWRPVAWFAAIGLATFFVGSAFLPGVIPETGNGTVNPFGFGGSIGTSLFGAMRPIGLVLVLISVPLALASLVFRYRAADRTQREQLRWLILAGVLVGLGILANPLVSKVVSDASTATDIGNAIASLTVTAVPIAIGIAILRYRLYDIDVVLNKTVVYGALAAFITGVYVAIVVGVGSLVGRGGQPNVALSILATGVVAIAFQPVRERVQRFANHLVYGKRATPYEVLSEFSDRLGGTYAAEDLLPRMARILAEGTGASRTDVWLANGSALRLDASWPQDAPALQDLPVEPFPDPFIPVRHQGELLGALSLEKRAGETLTATEQKLVEDLAGQAGLVLRNVRLTEELLARLEDLRASRQRLVAAQDEERRKLERNLHDGAQQQLVALSVKARLAQQLARRDPTKVAQMLEQIQADTSDALENLRDLARGIYPPLLADKGLVAALEAQARKAAVPTTVQGNGIGRFGQDVEAAVYFSCLEGLQNVAKYAAASRATIALSNGDGSLTFTVPDDGAGFDSTTTSYGTGLQGIAYRLAALGGTLVVTSEQGVGTTLEGQLPSAARRAGP